MSTRYVTVSGSHHKVEMIAQQDYLEMISQPLFALWPVRSHTYALDNLDLESNSLFKCSQLESLLLYIPLRTEILLVMGLSDGNFRRLCRAIDLNIRSFWHAASSRLCQQHRSKLPSSTHDAVANYRLSIQNGLTSFKQELGLARRLRGKGSDPARIMESSLSLLRRGRQTAVIKHIPSSLLL